MSAEPNEWSKATRRSKFGGMHLFIDATTLNYALSGAGIASDAELEVRRYALKDQKGMAKILLKIREVKHE